MKKISVTLAAALIAVPALFASNPAHANGGRITAGVVGGLVGGLILGSALAQRPVYAAEPVYVAPGPRCYWTYGAPVWDGYRWVRPQVQVCN